MGSGPDYPIIIFWSEEDGGYIADIPDISYCSAIGHSPQEALAELEIAKRLWSESVLEQQEPLPKPTPGAEIVSAARAARAG